MKNHSMIFDEFFDDPMAVKRSIDAEPINDIKYQDGVVYPNIAMLPAKVENEILAKLRTVFGPITPKLMFARYSFEHTNPPHWAHSDREIAEFLALIYLSEDFRPQVGTAVVRHALGFETHPTDPERQKLLIEHANRKELWEVVYECPARFNRMFVLNADLLHASMGEFGKTKEDGRLVVSVFFDGVKA